MTGLKLLRRTETQPNADGRSVAAELVAAEPVALSWSGGAALATRVVAGSLWAAVLMGPLALGLVVLGQVGSSSGARATASTAPVGVPVAVEDFAEDFVTTWLTAGPNAASELPAFYSGDLTQVANSAWPVTSASVANIDQRVNGSWTVTIAVTTASPSPTPASKGSSSSAAAASSTPAGSTGTAGLPVRDYFSVPVVYVAGGGHRQLTALTLPEQVPGPVPAGSVQSGYGSTVDPTSPIGEAAQGFLTTLLTGTGDITRYTTPGVTITAISPAPYTSVSLIAIDADDQLDPNAAPANGAVAQLRLTAELTAGPQRQLTAQYVLRLTARAGRWEVTAFDPTPPISLSNPQPFPTATPAISS